VGLMIAPHFSNEAEEAAWWYAHQAEVEAELRTRIKQRGSMSIFNSTSVKVGGILLSVASGALLLSGGHRLGYVVGVAVAVLALVKPKAFQWLADFADPEFWPAFVGLGVAILFAAHFGGTYGLLSVIGPLTTYDGMYFDQNY